MPQYRYRAVEASGRLRRGTMSAQGEGDLARRLRQNGLDLLDCRPDRERRAGGQLSLARLRPGIKPRDMIELFVHLEQLDRAGVPILEALEDVREATRSQRLRSVVDDIVQRVRSGGAVSDAFAAHPHHFGPVFVGLIATGEQTGSFAESFQHLVQHLKWLDETNSKIRRAVRYPIFLVVLLVLVITGIMAFLVPVLTEFLAAMGVELPLLTRALIATSQIFSTWWWAILGGPVLLVAALWLARRRLPRVAYWADRALYRVPVFGPLARKMALARFVHFFAIMQRAGVGLLESLDTARTVVGNRALATALEGVRQDVRTGHTLAQAFQRSGAFPRLVVRMIHVGEAGGAVDDALENVSYFYDRDVRDTVDTTISALEPVLIGIVGLVLAWIVAAVMMPMYDSLSDFVL